MKSASTSTVTLDLRSRPAPDAVSNAVHELLLAAANERSDEAVYLPEAVLTSW